MAGWRFLNHYHPYTCEAIGAINTSNLESGLLDPAAPPAPVPPSASNVIKELWRQRRHDRGFFDIEYSPGPAQVAEPYPIEEFDFGQGGAYSAYNWELFFFIPWLIVDRLHQNQRFEEALELHAHALVDLTDTSLLPAPQRYWKPRPLLENADVKHTVAKLLQLLDYAGADPALLAERERFEAQIVTWQKAPFNPHAIARLRLSAYQKAVVMQGMKIRMDLGDQLYRRRTIESINEATQHYLAVASMLGDRPAELPPVSPPPRTYRQLMGLLDKFKNAPVIELEAYLPTPAPAAPSTDGTTPATGDPDFDAPGELHALLALGRSLYFCTPQNDDLLSYWDRVSDRLFKIRNCLDIEGAPLRLPLFEPPIDPALLVRATAAGLDLGSVLDDLNAPLSNYRYRALLPQAKGLVESVCALGAAFLAAHKDREAEALTQLRSGQEIALLTGIRDVRLAQIEDARHALEALYRARDVASAREAFYTTYVAKNAGEAEELIQLADSKAFLQVSEGLELEAGFAALLPDMIAGTLSGAVTGATHVYHSLEAASRVSGTQASVANTDASLAARQAAVERRAEVASHEANLATRTITQIDAEIAAKTAGLRAAQFELRNSDRQTRQAKVLDEHHRRKFTNQELYSWTASQLAAVYFQSYRLAYDFARRVERAFVHELALPGGGSPSYITPYYWDSLKKGLLAGERLSHDLRRLEVAFLDSDRREFELTRSLSLATLAPLELVRLRQTGHCSLTLDEPLFDLDHPGHYFRRIKTVSLTIPCVVGPYTPVNCSLTLVSSRLRQDSSPGKSKGGYPTTGASDPRFREGVTAIRSIATSTAQNDAGLFEVGFGDDRYLPFEGAGAISTWQIELDLETNRFDANTVSDVILNLRYTARDGGEPLKNAAYDQVVRSYPREGLAHRFSAAHDSPSLWQGFLHPPAAAVDYVLDLNLSEDRFPYHLAKTQVGITRLTLFLGLKTSLPATASLPITVLRPAAPGKKSAGTPTALTLITDKQFPDVLMGSFLVTKGAKGAFSPGTWRISVAAKDLAKLTGGSPGGSKPLTFDPTKIRDLEVICEYALTLKGPA